MPYVGSPNNDSKWATLASKKGGADEFRPLLRWKSHYILPQNSPSVEGLWLAQMAKESGSYWRLINNRSIILHDRAPAVVRPSTNR